MEYFFGFIKKIKGEKSNVKLQLTNKNFLSRVKEKLTFFFPKREIFLQKVDELFLKYKSNHINYINNLNKI